jgi:predicted enzyme related to lactoylglutathione lyase
MSEEYLEFDLGDGPALGLDSAPFGALGPVVTGSVAIAVRDFEGVIASPAMAGRLTRPPFESPVCHGAFIEDSEGNRVLLHRRKAEAERDRLIDFVQLPIADMARARAFYEGLLGLEPQTVYGDGWTEYELPDGSAMALGDVAALGLAFAPVTGGSVGLAVSDLDTVFESLKAAGHALADELMETPVCHLGFVRDSEGNHLALHRRR